MRRDQLELPNTLIVAQVIFGSPLRDKQLIYSGDVSHFTQPLLGIGNHMRVIHRLVDAGWLTTHPAPQGTAETQRWGRPPSVVFIRTDFGWQQYTKLKGQLATCGIGLN